MSIRRNSAYLLVAMTVFTVVGAGISFALAERQREAVEKSQLAVAAVTTSGMELLGLIEDLRLNVVQVQQWLTDVSATRGLNGLDDGFDQASEQARLLKLNIARGAAIAGALGRPIWPPASARCAWLLGRTTRPGSEWPGPTLPTALRAATN